MGEWDVIKTEPIPIETEKVDEWEIAGEEPVAPGMPLIPFEGGPGPGTERAQFFVGGVPATGREFLAEIPPTALDIAATTLSPALKGTGMGVKALSAMMRAGAGGAGATAGELMGQQIRGEEMDPGAAAGVGGVTAGAELGLSGLGAAGKGLWRKVGRPTLDFLTEFTPLVGEPTRRLAARAARLEQRKQKGIKAEATERAVNFVEGMRGKPEKEVAGIRVGEVLAGKKEFKEVYRDYNKLIDEAAGPENELLMDDLTQHIMDKIETYKDEVFSGKHTAYTHTQAIKNVVKSLNLDDKSKVIVTDLIEQSGYLNKEDAKYMLSKLWKKFRDDTARTTRIKEQLKELALSDIGRGSQTGAAAAEAKKKADSIFASVNQWFRENPVAETITGKMRFGTGRYYEQFPERSVNRVFNALPEEAARIKAEVLKVPEGEQIWAGMELNYLTDIFENALVRSKDTGALRVQPAALADAIESKKAWIQKVMPESWSKLKEEADYFREIAPKFEAIDASDIWGVAQAWEILSPKGKKRIENLFKATGFGAQQLVAKPALRIMTREENGQTNP